MTKALFNVKRFLQNLESVCCLYIFLSHAFKRRNKLTASKKLRFSFSQQLNLFDNAIQSDNQALPPPSLRKPEFCVSGSCNYTTLLGLFLQQVNKRPAFTKGNLTDWSTVFTLTYFDHGALKRTRYRDEGLTINTVPI